jgi:release factor glutamine methyltransferase
MNRINDKSKQRALARKKRSKTIKDTKFDSTRWFMAQSDQSDEIYPPAEDTFLLLKAALKEALPGDRAIEIGCGSALISRELSCRVHSLVATDINPHAVKRAQAEGIDAVRADLFNGIMSKFDLVVFNPPYVPTKAKERTTGWINLAVDGGETGRDTINRFLEDLRDHLNPEGRALLLVSSLNGVENIMANARGQGLQAREVIMERYFFEQLYVIRLQIEH